MTTPNHPSNTEGAAEPADVIVRRLVRSLDYAEGFWLGFVKCNLAAQRRKAAAVCRELLEPFGLRLIEVELTEPISELLPVLKERIASVHGSFSETSSSSPVAERFQSRDRRKSAIFVSGLEHSIPSSEAYPPLLSYLNLNRELFRQELPHPLVIWLPEYALTALARRAPDFWAWRSGLYEFAPEADLVDGALDPILQEEMHVKSSLSGKAKRERISMLKGLLADYYELGDGPHEREIQSHILFEIGLVHYELGEWAEAKQALGESIAIARNQPDEMRVAVITHNLGVIAQNLADYAGARSLHEESLKIERKLGNKSGEASTLHHLGRLAHDLGNYDEARRLYEGSLDISRESDNKYGVAVTSHELGRLAQDMGDYEEAWRLYQESLKIERELGDKSNEANTLVQLGTLAKNSGNYEEARRLYEESLKIKRGLGDKHAVAVTLHQLGMVSQVVGNYEEARRLYEESLKIKQELGDKFGEAFGLAQLALLDEEKGNFKKAIEHSRQAEEIFLRLGIREYITRIREQVRGLEKKAPPET
jgi:tetratricopeptide (TPR) repeat protein